MIGYLLLGLGFVAAKTQLFKTTMSSTPLAPTPVLGARRTGGIQNLNGTSRKPAKPIKGARFAPGVDVAQHRTIGFVGKTYNSPFTTSGKPLFNDQRDNSTQPALPALQVESPGHVVATADFVKVHPNEKGATFHPTPPGSRPLAFRAGGPSKTANTAANPNKTVLHPRPVRVTSLRTHVHNMLRTPQLSFLRSGGTLAAKSGHDVYASRWSTIKKGVIE